MFARVPLVQRIARTPCARTRTRRPSGGEPDTARLERRR